MRIAILVASKSQEYTTIGGDNIKTIVRGSGLSITRFLRTPKDTPEIG